MFLTCLGELTSMYCELPIRVSGVSQCAWRFSDAGPAERRVACVQRSRARSELRDPKRFVRRLSRAFSKDRGESR